MAGNYLILFRYKKGALHMAGNYLILGWKEVSHGTSKGKKEHSTWQGIT